MCSSISFFFLSGTTLCSAKHSISTGPSMHTHRHTHTRALYFLCLFLMIFSSFMKWYRVVLDEAHSIKNRQTRQAKACFSLQSHIRWALSATPIQNTVDDLYSLFRFLEHDPYAG